MNDWLFEFGGVANDSLLDRATAYAAQLHRAPRTARHNFLYGGIRFSQKRVRPRNLPQCVARPFLSEDSPAERSTFTEVQARTLSLIEDAISNVGWKAFLDAVSVDDLTRYIFGFQPELIDVIVGLRDPAVGLGLGSIQPNVTLERGGDSSSDTLAANITLAAALLNRSKSSAGDVWLCYPDFSSGTSSNEPYGPLGQDDIIPS